MLESPSVVINTHVPGKKDSAWSLGIRMLCKDKEKMIAEGAIGITMSSSRLITRPSRPKS